MGAAYPRRRASGREIHLGGRRDEPWPTPNTLSGS